jgi:hypothetical protein
MCKSLSTKYTSKRHHFSPTSAYILRVDAKRGSIGDQLQHHAMVGGHFGKDEQRAAFCLPIIIRTVWHMHIAPG